MPAIARRALLRGGVAAPALAALPGAVAAEPPVSIGLLLAMTGSLARASEDIAFGVALALEGAGWRGGGRNLRVVVDDTAGDPQRALERFAHLVAEEKVDLVIGPTSSPEALALRDAAHEAGIPLIVPNAGVNALTGERCSPFVIRASYANEQIAAPLGTWLAETGRAKSAYLLASDNLSGRDHVASFGRAFTAAGGEIAGEELVPPGTRDLSPYLGKIRLTRADTIFASFFGEAAQRVLEALDEFGLRGPKLCGPGWLTTTLDLPRAGAKAAGILGSAVWLPDLDLPENRAFIDAFTARYQRTPTEFAALGHDAARLVLAGLEALDGSTKNRRALATVLARTPFVGARGELAIDPRSNNVIEDVYLFETRPRAGGEGIDFEILHRVVGVAVDPDLCHMPG